MKMIKTGMVILHRMYQLLRKCLFLLDAERAHHFSMKSLKLLMHLPLVKLFLQKRYSISNPAEFLGLHFMNPVGLGAGFDKNAMYLNELQVLGFGFVEIGTVTPLAQEGNPKPRLFRLPQDKALINRMGFNNDGAERIAKRLEKWRKKNPLSKLIVGGNIGKNKNTPNDEAWKDYAIVFEKLYELVDYFAVNVSSPNTPGLRELQTKEQLRNIFIPLIQYRANQTIHKPILLKIAPDLAHEDVDAIMELVEEIKIDGIIVSNTTIDRSNLQTNQEVIEKIGNGGLSGAPLLQKSNNLLKYIHQKNRSNVLLIGSGGIINETDATQKIASGAKLLQIWTGFIYTGPSLIKQIAKQYK
jgi:dihydroorotate dehydrogenase